VVTTCGAVVVTTGGTVVVTTGGAVVVTTGGAVVVITGGAVVVITGGTVVVITGVTVVVTTGGTVVVTTGGAVDEGPSVEVVDVEVDDVVDASTNFSSSMSCSSHKILSFHAPLEFRGAMNARMVYVDVDSSGYRFKMFTLIVVAPVRASITCVAETRLSLPSRFSLRTYTFRISC